jgi:peptide/nickel transport system permease protein
VSAAFARFLLRRGAAAAALLLLVLTATFILLHLAPGDPTLILSSPRIPPEQRERLREIYGLDRSLGAQYLSWLSAAMRGDWGMSFVHHREVTAVLASALPATALLAAAVIPLEAALGLALGVAAARRRDRPLDHALRAVSLIVYSLPVFWLGLMAILLFSVRWPIFPASHLRSVDSGGAGFLPSGIDLARHLALPALVLAVSNAGGLARFVRNSMIEALSQDYIRTARAAGVSERRIVWRHALRNTLPPLIQILGLQLPMLLSGSLVIEVVFAWPGVGRLAYDAILSRDYPVVLATTALAGVLVVAGNLLADLLQAAADPRVRRAG